MPCSSNIELLIDRWIGDRVFRAAMCADREDAARTAGFAMSADEQAVARAIDWGQSDDQLIKRLSKGWCSGG